MQKSRVKRLGEDSCGVTQQGFLEEVRLELAIEWYVSFSPKIPLFYIPRHTLLNSTSTKLKNFVLQWRIGGKSERPPSAHWSQIWDGTAEPTYLTGHHLPLAKTLHAAPAQLLGPDLFSKPVVSLLIGPDLLQLDLVFNLASFFSAVSILGLCYWFLKVK